jgi:hypothetical protein
MEQKDAEAAVASALWKKETGMDRVYTNSKQVTPEVMQALEIPATQTGGAMAVEGYDNLARLSQAGADFANRSHYKSGNVRGV